MKDQDQVTSKNSKTSRTSATNRVAPPPMARPKQSHGSFGKTIGLILLVVAVAVASGTVGAWLVGRSDSPLTVINRSGGDGNSIKSSGEVNIANVASKVSPSVVSIVTNVTSRQGRQGEAAGTGIIVSKDGYIMTNKHVISGARSVTITTYDGVAYDNVKIVGEDPLNDVAFLKVNNAKDLKPAEIGESSTLQIGQNVVAIGNSLGQFSGTVTSGIISGMNRPVSAQSDDGSNSETLTGMLQTDAAINPGNSGGPLVNLAGQVVGINTAVASDAQGIGFAIPIDATKGMLAGVLEKGKIERVYLGVRYTDVTPVLAKEQNLSVREGALVSSQGGVAAVVSGSPADKAGIKNNDILTKINDQVIGRDGSVNNLLGQYRPGDTVEVTLMRDGKKSRQGDIGSVHWHCYECNQWH